MRCFTVVAWLAVLFLAPMASFAKEKGAVSHVEQQDSVVKGQSDSVPQDKGKDAVEILRRAEEIRNIESAILQVSLTTTGGAQESDYGMKVTRGKGRRAYIEFERPASEVGRRMVVVGDRYWARFPDSRRVHPISRREMLGNSVFSLVDLFQFDTEASYHVVLQGEERIGEVASYHLVLTAKNDEVPYAKIDYFIAKEDYFPVEARFYSSLGRRIKTLHSGTQRQELAGRLRPVSFTMHDDVVRGRKSVWHTHQAEISDIPEHLFSPQYLRQ